MVEVTLQDLIDGVLEIGQVHRKHYGHAERKYKSAGDQNPLYGIADTEADMIVHRRYGANGLGLNIISEESLSVDNGSEDTIYADGLDGTTNFFDGFPYYGVSFGVSHLDELVMGVVLDTPQDILYMAEKGCGAFKRDNKTGKEVRIHTKNTVEIAEVLLAIPSLRKKSPETYKKFAEMFPMVQGTRSHGSTALDCCNLAAGVFDVVAMHETGGPWDYAGGIPIIQEAGGYTGTEEGRLFDITKDRSAIFTANEELYWKFQKQFFG